MCFINDTLLNASGSKNVAFMLALVDKAHFNYKVHFSRDITEAAHENGPFLPLQ